MIERKKDDLWDKYFYPGTDVLVNCLNIKDYKELKEKEATCTAERLFELLQCDILRVDKNRLNSIHRYLFKDIYPFAGEYRKVNMIKERGSFLFVSDEDSVQTVIDDKLNELFKEIDNMIFNCHSKWDFCEILAKLYTGLIFIHPYREGNGRTIREFVREYSIKKSDELGIGMMELDWSLIKKEKLDEYIEVVHLFPSSISSMFMNALVLKDNNKNR